MAALNLSVAATADGLGVPAEMLSELVGGLRPVTPDLALRLELAGWGTAEGWLRSQAIFDLWQAKQSGTRRVRRFADETLA